MSKPKLYASLAAAVLTVVAGLVGWSFQDIKAGFCGGPDQAVTSQAAPDRQ